MILVRVIAVLLLVTIPLSCTDSRDTIERRQVFAVGTLVEITLVNPPADSGVALRAAEAALLAAEHRWRAWNEGELATVNRDLLANGTAALTPELHDGIKMAMSISKTSAARFNPLIGKLVELWGFHQEERSPGPPPEDKDIRALVDPPLDASAITLDADSIHSSDARIRLDMGAFAKGLAVESAISALQANGIENAIVNAGGDLKAIGRRGNRDWRIGVRHPSGVGVIASLDISGALSVFTSGNYERRFTWNNETYHHIIDPATGYPASDFDSVTVVHADAALADAAATAIFVAGLSHWQETAAALGIKEAMVVTTGGRIIATPAMTDRIKVEEGISVETRR